MFVECVRAVCAMCCPFLFAKCVCLVRTLLCGAVWVVMCCVSVFVDVCMCAFG